MTITPPTTVPRFTWENLHVGDDLGHVEGIVDEAAVRAHAFAIGDTPERYLNGIGAAGPVVPPSLLVNDLLKLFLIGYDCTPPWPGGLHTRAQIEYPAPLPLGERVAITGSHIAKYIKRGRRYRSCLSEATRADGTVVARMIATETVGYRIEGDADSSEPPVNWADGLPRVSGVIPEGAVSLAPGEHIHAGAVLGPIARSVSLEQSVIFSGYPFGWAREKAEPLRQGLHTNPEIARNAGYPAPVAQGLMSASHMTSLLLDHFGERVFQGARLSLSFVSPVIAGTTLTTHGVVGTPVSDASREWTSLELASRNSEGSLTTVGYARVPFA